MAEEHAAKPELYVRIEAYGRYRAWSKDGIEFRGNTVGYAKDVEEILRRMVRAEADPPEAVAKTVKLLFEHVEAYLRHNVLGDDYIGTAVEYSPGPHVSCMLRIEVETVRVDVMMVDGGDGPAEPGWLVTIKATYEGYDGSGEGRHRVTRKLVFKGRVDAGVLWSELMRVVRRAVNALPPEWFYVWRKI
jgi:hypothetical protein